MGESGEPQWDTLAASPARVWLRPANFFPHYHNKFSYEDVNSRGASRMCLGQGEGIFDLVRGACVVVVGVGVIVMVGISLLCFTCP